METNYNKHLTLDERKIIETGIRNRSTKSSIANTLGKDGSTIGKEIKLHRQLKDRNQTIRSIDCALLTDCKHKPCLAKCEDYVKPVCNQRDRSPGACNGCKKYSRCKMDKYWYDAEIAHRNYLEILIDSREGVNLTTSEINSMADVIVPLIKKGQSVYQILISHPELGVSEKTLYNYISAGVFREHGLIDIDLRVKVKRKLSKKVKTKKRKDNAYLEGRRYTDFKRFMEQEPNTVYVEMDTVYNDQSGPYIQTFIFPNQCFMIGILHQNKTSETMLQGIEQLHKTLGDATFRMLFPVILTDRGTEFAACEQVEFDKYGELRTRIFYCDPMQSSQKPHVENNHRLIRYILPKAVSFNELTQEKLDLMFSHINSLPREVLNGKTPTEMIEFLYGKKLLEKLEIKKIDKDLVILKPYLLK